jgi:hypothetical protein
VWAYIILREALGTLADTYGAGQASRSIIRSIRRLLARIRHVPDVVERHKGSWNESGATPQDIYRLIDRQAWDPDVLASLLRFTREEAETLLQSRGFVHDPTRNIWQPAQDGEAQTLRRVTSEWIYRAEWSADSEEGREALRLELETRIIEELRTDEAG